MSAVMVLGLLVVAAFCLQAEAGGSDGALVDLNLDLKAKIQLHLLNKLDIDVRLLVGEDDEVLEVKAGAVGLLGPVIVKLQALDLLKVKVLLFGKDGKLLTVKGDLTLDLSLVAKVVLGDVKEVKIDLVEELIGEDGKLIKVIVDLKVIAAIEIELGKPAGPVVDVDALVKVGVENKLKDINVRLVVKAGALVNVNAGGVGVVGPVAVKLKVLDLLRVQLFLFGKDGKVLAVKGNLLLNLRVLAKVVVGVKELVVSVVEELVGKDGKLIKVYVEATLVAVIDLGH